MFDSGKTIEMIQSRIMPRIKTSKTQVKFVSWDKFLIKEAKELFKKGIILDVGGNEPYWKWLSSFPRQHKAKYFSLDYVYNVHPHIVGDAHRLPCKDESVDSIILNTVLEHVRNPFVVMSEVERVLRPGGRLLLWVPFLHSYHADQTYKDYYRFTQDGVEELLKKFSGVTIIPDQAYFEMLASLLPGLLGRFSKEPARLLNRLIHVRAQYMGFGALAIK
jgi:SAM-dependent methyltransferase